MLTYRVGLLLGVVGCGLHELHAAAGWSLHGVCVRVCVCVCVCVCAYQQEPPQSSAVPTEQPIVLAHIVSTEP